MSLSAAADRLDLLDATTTTGDRGVLLDRLPEPGPGVQRFLDF